MNAFSNPGRVLERRKKLPRKSMIEELEFGPTSVPEPLSTKLKLTFELLPPLYSSCPQDYISDSRYFLLFYN